MTRWLALALVLALVCLLWTSGDAQSPPSVRPRFATVSGGEDVQPATAPTVNITTPTALSTFQTDATTLTLAGIAQSVSTIPLASVDWTCATCTPTSGSALGTLTWNTVTGTSATPVFQASFTGGSNVALVQTVPDVGTSFTEVIDTTAGGTGYAERRLAGYVQPNTSYAAGGAPAIITIATPSPAIAGSDYSVAVDLVHISGIGADDAQGLIFGYADTSNYCGVMWYGPGATTDLYVFSRVAGDFATIASANVDPAAGDTIRVAIDGEDIVVSQNDVAKITTASAVCDDALGVGFGFGALTGIATDDIVAVTRFDNFTVVDNAAAAGGISLGLGANTIIVTVTDAEMNTGTDTIVVTRGATDTTAPALTISQPTTSPTLATTTAAQTFSGSTSDNVGVSTVTWACAACTPTSGTATLTNGISWTFSASVACSGGGTANTVTVTATDAAMLTGTDQLVVTCTSSDVTAPTISITAPNGGANVTVMTTTVIVGGTASDNVSLASINPSCDRCSVGTVSGLGEWSFTATLAPGANIISVVSNDLAGNPSTADTITITLDVPLAITTTALPAGTQNVAYSVCLSAIGGTAPYGPWSQTAGTLPTGLTLSAMTGCITGTPTVIETATGLEFDVDDAVMATAGSAVLSLEIRDPAAEGPHDYFDDLVARGDCYKAFSFRPVVGQPPASDCSSPHYANQIKQSNQGGYLSTNSPVGTFTYDPATDTHAEKQDATKFTIPAFGPNGTTTLAAPLNDTETTVTLSVALSASNNRGMRFAGSDEVMTIDGAQGTTTSIRVKRGQAGTTATAHSAGGQLYLSTNSVAEQLRVPLGTCTFATATPFCLPTDSTVTASYLYIWDVLWTSSYVATGLTNHKTFQFSSGNDTFWFEPNTRFSNPSCCPAPGFDPAVHVATSSGRAYSQIAPPATAQEPLQPLLNPFIIRPSKWTRFFVKIDAYEDTDPAGFENVTTLAADAPIGSLILTINHPASIFANPFTTPPYYLAGGTAPNNWPGRTVKIGDEIMTMVSGPTSGSPRDITVVRGTNGTTEANHLAGAAVQLSHDYVTMYVADEDTEPVLQYDRLPLGLYISRVDPAQRGSLFKLWFEYNTSTNTVPVGRAAAGFPDMVGYQRNFIGLMNPPADWSALRLKPVRD